ncbi:hypothetical protein TBS_07120 [Thermobispora bispora]|jgi:hypothetical protein|uniref:Uncharacterized protein n=1 Tax=Thermobispora bispora (strain ATCC 19993 / DSM 43833 / CBS 139.67 / JCM 10125 / KCTC 9307 / NBRC 14880 / R51) TaxID=469371 RepID=D6YB58_THEBD|nr:hypothetical protein [Thermobispora bispora]MBO2475261.1 hypothetical protein [Actinomycetales bacterium]MDI9581626.1 hypothetical protein [Thermobispora sp.]ADG88418.1 hypothetical protein Tbis_1705 [Thermobispora bispora DSM 43833]MBX6169037.1 hypothetical protein [Thermobispora bispora]QSI48234.1 hypothetical protein CYL17_10545 [Thermobispora bispora]
MNQTRKRLVSAGVVAAVVVGGVSVTVAAAANRLQGEDARRVEVHIPREVEDDVPAASPGDRGVKPPTAPPSDFVADLSEVERWVDELTSGLETDRGGADRPRTEDPRVTITIAPRE